MELWLEIIIIIAKTASTFHNGLAANNENLVLNFANNGDITPRYPSVITPLLQSNFHPRHIVSDFFHIFVLLLFTFNKYCYTTLIYNQLFNSDIILA